MNNITVIEGYKVEIYDVELKHPDTGSYFTRVSVNTNDMIDSHDVAEIIKAIWNTVNANDYFHEMCASLTIDMDDILYTYNYYYNGCDTVEILPTKTRYVK